MISLTTKYPPSRHFAFTHVDCLDNVTDMAARGLELEPALFSKAIGSSVLWMK